MGISTTVRRAVFLDRDGVINRPIVRGGRPFAPVSLDEFELLPGVPDALARLRGAGLRLVVVTNQPEVSRGTMDRDVIDAIHARLTQELPVDDLRVCFHDDRHGCGCRKPRAGLLEDAARDAGIALGASFLVGDRWRDIEAGRRAGCRTIFVDWSYAEPRPNRPDVTVPSLSEAADWILHTLRNEAS